MPSQELIASPAIQQQVAAELVDAFNAPLLFLLCGVASIFGLRAASRLPERAARRLSP